MAVSQGDISYEAFLSSTSAPIAWLLITKAWPSLTNLRAVDCDIWAVIMMPLRQYCTVLVLMLLGSFWKFMISPFGFRLLKSRQRGSFASYPFPLLSSPVSASGFVSASGCWACPLGPYSPPSPFTLAFRCFPSLPASVSILLSRFPLDSDYIISYFIPFVKGVRKTLRFM